MKKVLDLVVKDRDAQEHIGHELNEYNSTSQATKLELGKIYCHRAKTYEYAINIMGDVMFNKSCEVTTLRDENNYLKEQISNAAVLDKDLLERKKIDPHRVKSHTNEEKNKIIFNGLKQVMRKLKNSLKDEGLI
jgi:hypothetical protein